MIVPIANAHTGFFAGVDFGSSNVWIGTGINALTSLVNYGLEEADCNFAIGGRTSLNIFNFKDDGRRVAIYPDDYYGIKQVYGFDSDNLFGHINGNVKIGWMGAFSPIGIYFHCGYDYRNFTMQRSYETDFQRHKIGTLKTGVGIRISPCNFYDSDMSWKPIFEFGTDYNMTISYKGPYNNDKNQINDGLNYSASLGVTNIENVSILLGAEWYGYDILNREYTNDNGLYYPYYNLTSRIVSIVFSLSYGF